MGFGIRRRIKSALKGLFKTATGFFADRGVGYGVGEYEDFDSIRRSARDESDREENALKAQGEELAPIEDGIQEIGASELKKALEGDSAPLLIDVRETYEWEGGHIDKALHIPLGSLKERLAELPDKSADIVTYCAAGMRSIDGAYVLKMEGYTQVRSLAGGISAWGAGGGPIVR